MQPLAVRVVDNIVPMTSGPAACLGSYPLCAVSIQQSCNGRASCCADSNVQYASVTSGDCTGSVMHPTQRHCTAAPEKLWAPLLHHAGYHTNWLQLCPCHAWPAQAAGAGLTSSPHAICQEAQEGSHRLKTHPEATCHLQMQTHHQQQPAPQLHWPQRDGLSFHKPQLSPCI